MYPRKGVIKPGSDADIVLWDPDKSHSVSAGSHRQAIDYSVFEGYEFIGSPSLTILNGQVVFENGRVNVAAGAGTFVARSPR
jgi:dihydropyrimidinase